MTQPSVSASVLELGAGASSDTTAAFTVPAGGAVVCWVGTSDGSPPDITSISWSLGGGEALSRVSNGDSGVVQSFMRGQIWARANPTAGSGTLTVTFAASTFAYAIVGIAVADPGTIGAATWADGNGSGTDAEVTIASAVNALVLAASYRLSDDATPGGSQTLLQEGQAGGEGYLSATSQDGAASVLAEWAPGAGSVSSWQFVVGGLSIAEAGGGGAAANSNLLLLGVG
jgi:hypothetical protein